MLNDSDLRVGNLIKNHDGTICPVTHVSKREDGTIQVSALCHPPDSRFGGYVETFREIPIDIKVLEASGFTKTGNTHVFKAKDGTTYEIALRGSGSVDLSINGTKLKSGILAVHSLQNIVSALSGEELPIKI
jgi:hypothetical protein